MRAVATTRILPGSDGRQRCAWCVGDALYQRYHDEEWGRPVVDDRRLFEKLCLEGFQAGLSWLTILRKRERFRAVFAGFDPAAVARFGPADVARLLRDPGIVRHRGKIEATIANARAALATIAEHGSLAAYVWSSAARIGASPAGRERAARELSRDLKRRGWRFVGPTTVFSFLQAMGLINDHAPGCGWGRRCAADRRRLVIPPAAKPSARAER